MCPNVSLNYLTVLSGGRSIIILILFRCEVRGLPTSITVHVENRRFKLHKVEKLLLIIESDDNLYGILSYSSKWSSESTSFKKISRI